MKQIKDTHDGVMLAGYLVSSLCVMCRASVTGKSSAQSAAETAKRTSQRAMQVAPTSLAWTARLR